MFAESFDTAQRLPAGMYFYVVFLTFEGWCVLATGYDMAKNGALAGRSASRYVAG